MDVINPSTGALSVTLATDTSSTLQGKFAALSRSKWADSSVGDRVAVVRAFQSRLMAAADELAATMAKEVQASFAGTWRSRGMRVSHRLVRGKRSRPTR